MKLRVSVRASGGVAAADFLCVDCRSAEHDRLLCCQADCPDAGSSSSGRQVSPAGSRRILFVSIKVAGGLLIASPFVLYEIIQFVLPGLTRRERRLIGPVVLGSTVLFVAGLVFAYLLIPAALNFFINYGGMS